MLFQNWAKSYDKVITKTRSFDNLLFQSEANVFSKCGKSICSEDGLIYFKVGQLFEVGHNGSNK